VLGFGQQPRLNGATDGRWFLGFSFRPPWIFNPRGFLLFSRFEKKVRVRGQGIETPFQKL
jgi:hypothetical protein